MNRITLISMRDGFDKIFVGHRETAGHFEMTQNQLGNPELKTASPEWCRQRIADLASGGEPVFKSILESKAMAAKRTRTNKKA